MKRAGPFLLMFAVCFLGVYGALMFHDYFAGRRSGSESLTSLANEPLHQPSPGSMKGFEDAAGRLIPAVVAVFRKSQNPWSNQEGLQTSGEGSGVIITADGYIVTNHHVIESGDAVTIRMSDGRAFEATVVGQDPISDLALLKVDARGLPFAELVDDSKLKIGEWVLAVGNPLGYEGTLSVGVVSALHRDLEGDERRAPLVGAIQTDAAINSGNSGGALANINGQVIGINTQIASVNRGNIGIGFAIPSQRVQRFVKDIQRYGRPRHPDLGLQQPLPSFWLRDARFEKFVGANPPEEGVIINVLAEGSPLEKAGLGQFDVIISLNKTELRSLNDYMKFLLKAEIGDEVTVKYWQKGQTKTVTVALVEMHQ
ncbi:MAG: trypsin-like peptidase domain-containing protein [Fimbriimonadales bacterium]